MQGGFSMPDLQKEASSTEDRYKEFLQRTVEKRFKGKDSLQSKTKPIFPATAEREYTRLARAYTKLLIESIKPHLPEIQQALKQVRTDAKHETEYPLKSGMLRVNLDRIFDKITTDFAKKAGRMKLYDELERISGLTKASAIREWKRVVKDTLGVDLYADYYTGDFFKQAIDRWVEDNVSYIKSVPEETLGEMKDVILDGYEQGKTYTSIVSDIQDRYNVSKSKAKFLARDQISTLNAQITKKQQTDAGCNSYIWSTSKDSRVRDCHASLDGKEFSWDDPPEMWYMTKSGIKYSGRRCHPGEDYCCRCVALPKFIFEDIDIPV